jgi:hypothetical protein
MSRLRWGLAALAVAAVLAVPASRAIRSLVMTHGAMASFTALVASGNAQDLDSVRRLCSAGYLARHAIKRAIEGGVVGLPRNIHQNFQVWRQGDEVWLCPTNRVGPVYRFVSEDGTWKFAGLVGMLGPGGRIERTEGDSDLL